MPENVTLLGDVADDFDALVAHNEKFLDDYVEEQGYGLGTMVVASGLIALMKFSKTFVDVGRLGNGVFIKGGWRGLLEDGLRALNLAGGAGAAVGRFHKMIKMTVQVGNTCAWTSQANALRLAGHRWFITASQLADEAGVAAGEWKAIVEAGRRAQDYSLMEAAMLKMGIPHATAVVGTLDEALAAVKAYRGGVITFSIRFGEGGKLGHRLYATWDKALGMVIRDPNTATGFYRTLADLKQVFGATVQISKSPLIYVPNSMLLKAAEAAQAVAGPVAALVPVALQYVPATQTAADDAETAAQAVDIRDRTEDGNPGAAKAEHTVRTGDTLNGIAKKHYGKPGKWPAIYLRNRKPIGKDPNRIRTGQKLVIPQLPKLKVPARPFQASVPLS